MKKLFRFLFSLFQKQKEEEQPPIETREFGLTLKCFTQLALPRITDILMNEREATIKTNMYGSPSASYENVVDPYNIDNNLNVISGTVYIVGPSDCLIAVDIDAGCMNIHVEMTAASRDPRILKDAETYITDFLTYLSKEITYEKLIKTNGKFEISKKETFFGVDYVLTPLIMKTVPKVYLEADSKFLLTKFLMPAIVNQGKVTALFTGPYGNGKTETSMLIGEHAAQEDLVMYYVDKSKELKDILLALANINALNNTLIFAEDIDEILSGNSRKSDDNQILNIIDGLKSKQKNLKIILTTNHANRLNPALRRPGRIDILVPFPNPSPELMYEIFLDTFGDAEVAQFCVDKTKDMQLSVASVFQLINRIKSIENYSKEDIMQCVTSLIPQLNLMKAETEISPKEEFVSKLVNTFVVKNLQFSPFEAENL
jgi:hypothetical protein